MEGHLLLFFAFSALVSLSICCILTDSGADCSMSGLTFGGRLTFPQTDEDEDRDSSPWDGKRRFIFQTPKSSHPFLHPQRGSGWGRIWVGNSKSRGCETQSFCPPNWKRSGFDGRKSQDLDTIAAPFNLKEDRQFGKLVFEWDGKSDKHEYSFIRNGEENNVITDKKKVILQVDKGDEYSFKVRGFSPKKSGEFTKPITGVFHP